MANPQVENGHIDIANDIADNLMHINLKSYEWRILWLILRKTYGWHKKMDCISLSQFEEFTLLDRSSVCKNIKSLIKKNIIIKKQNKYGFQKDYDKWVVAQQPLAKLPLAKQPIGSGRLANQVVAQQPHTKETITKETNTKEKNIYADFVYMTKEEYGKLIVRFGEIGTKERIENLSLYALKIGEKKFKAKYSNHYAVILSWNKMEEKNGKHQKDSTKPKVQPGKYDNIENR